MQRNSVNWLLQRWPKWVPGVGALVPQNLICAIVFYPASHHRERGEGQYWHEGPQVVLQTLPVSPGCQSLGMSRGTSQREPDGSPNSCATASAGRSQSFATIVCAGTQRRQAVDYSCLATIASPGCCLRRQESSVTLPDHFR